MKHIYVLGRPTKTFNSVMLQTQLLVRELQDIFDVHLTYINKSEIDEFAGKDNCVVICPYGSFRPELLIKRNLSNFIFIYHNITPARYFIKSEPLVALRAIAGRLQLRLLSNRGLAWIAVSKYNKEELERVGNKIVYYCPNIIDNLKKDISPKSEVPSLLYVGRIVQNKNCLELSKVVLEVANRLNRKIRFNIVGTGKVNSSYFKKFTNSVDAFGSMVELNWLDSIDEEQLSKLYQESWLYVSTSLHEGFGLPACESIINGTPTVYTRSGGQESVLDNVGLVEDKQEMVSEICVLLSNKEKREKLLFRQAEKVMPYTKEHIIDIIKPVFESLII